MEYYNILLNITGKKCVVVGGGGVALRKVKKLCLANAKVTVIAPEIHPELKNICPPVSQIIERNYTDEDLDDAFLVFATTSSLQTNKQICKQCETRGILVNSVNGVDFGNFILPATCTQGILNIGISTQGKAPSLSKHIRKYLQNKTKNIKLSLLDEIVELRGNMIQSTDIYERQKIENLIDKKVEQILLQIDK